MPRSTNLAGQQLEVLVLEVDRPGLADWLLTATPAALTDARAWYRTGRRWTRQQYEWDGELARSRRDRRNDGEFGWIEAILAAGLTGPRSAAGWVPWDHFWDHMDSSLREPFDRVTAGRGAEWAAEFVATAATSKSARGTVALYHSLLPLILAYRLPVPAGVPFATGWLAARNGWGRTFQERMCHFDRLAELRTDPLLPDIFHYSVEYGLLPKLAEPLDTTIWLLKNGKVDRARLLEQVWDLLTGQPPVATQRLLAQLITQLDIADADVPGGLAYLQGVLATAHGAVGKVLLPYAIRALATAEDVVELAVTIAGRPEKAQKQTLLDALADPGLESRVGPAAVVESLITLRDEDDAKTCQRIDTLLGRLRPATEFEPLATNPCGLWDLNPTRERYEIHRLGEWASLDRDVLAHIRRLARNQDEVRSSPTWPAEQHLIPRVRPDFLLAALVREAWSSGPAAVAQALAGITWMTNEIPFIEGVRDALRDGTAQSYFAAFELVGDTRTGRTGDQSWTWSLWQPSKAFRYLMARESMVRLGRTPCLLSTPSHSDSSVSFDALLPRLEANQGAAFGPLDLLQTLLRLRPVDPAELQLLDGLTLPLDTAVSHSSRPCLITDGIEAIRAWVIGGGLPDLDPQVESGNWVTNAEFPVPLEGFGAVPADMLRMRPWVRPDLQHIVPAWPDLSSIGHQAIGAAAGGARLAEEDEWKYAPYPGGRTTRIGFDQLLQMMGTSDDRVTVRRVNDLLDLIVNDRFDLDLFCRAALDRLELNVLALPRILPVWDQIAIGGGLRQLWPAAIALADAGCRMKPKPTGLAGLLLWLERYLPEVPDPQLPEGLRQLAGQRGDTKSHHQARALAAAFDRLAA